jgi:hypothetical protein
MDLYGCLFYNSRPGKTMGEKDENHYRNYKTI